MRGASATHTHGWRSRDVGVTSSNVPPPARSESVNFSRRLREISTIWSDRVRFEKTSAECDYIFCKISVLIR